MKYLGPPQSGSVANETFSRNRFGQYVRARIGRGGVPSHPLTAAVAAWQALTAEQQFGWNAWADLVSRRNSLGAVKVCSGYQRFVSAFWLGNVFGVPPTDAPIERSDCTIASVSAALTGTDQVDGSAVVGGSDAGYVMFDFTFQGASLGTTRPPGRGTWWRFIGGSSVPAGGSAGTNLSYAVLAKGKVWVRAWAFGGDLLPGPKIVAGPVVVS
jgi:hypothetical protein